jgi:hypothetical protein
MSPIPEANSFDE